MPSELAEGVREVVERLRAERGLSVNALAAASGLGQRTLARRLGPDASTPLDVDDLDGLARAFGCTPQQLLDWAAQ